MLRIGCGGAVRKQDSQFGGYSRKPEKQWWLPSMILQKPWEVVGAHMYLKVWPVGFLDGLHVPGREEEPGVLQRLDLSNWKDRKAIWGLAEWSGVLGQMCQVWYVH